MGDTTVLQAFARRLVEICPQLKVPLGRGRDTALARLAGVSPNAARKWFEGEGMPELHRCIDLANRAGVSVLWFIQGLGPKDIHEAQESPMSRVFNALPEQSQQAVLDYLQYQVERTAPLEVREQAAKWLSPPDVKA